MSLPIPDITFNPDPILLLRTVVALVSALYDAKQGLETEMRSSIPAVFGCPRFTASC